MKNFSGMVRSGRGPASGEASGEFSRAQNDQVVEIKIAMGRVIIGPEGNLQSVELSQFIATGSGSPILPSHCLFLLEREKSVATPEVRGLFFEAKVRSLI